VESALHFDRLVIAMKSTFFIVLFFVGVVVSPLYAVPLQVQMSQRILTPNGDGINDRVVFHVTAPAEGSIDTSVVNSRGRRIAGLIPGAQGHFEWDGKDSQGRIVASGVYLVQISQGPGLWNGVVAVAK
jgi:hypothetical protein